MRKQDLVRKAGKKRFDTKAMVDTIFCSINEALIRREKVIVLHFGRFEVVQSKVRGVYDWKTKKRRKITPKLKIKFTPSPAVLKIINKENVVI